MRVDRTGTFKAKITDKSISTTKNGFPQLVASFLIQEMYDPQEGEWVDYREFQMETIGYLVLVGKNRKTGAMEATLNCTQVMKAMDWDGGSLADLNAMDTDDMVVQIRVEEDTYEGAKHPFKVNWIDAEDADPVRGLRKLDPGDIKDLDNQFNSVLKAVRKPKAAASAKKATPKKVDKKEKEKGKSASKKLAPPPPPPADHPEPKVDTAEPEGKCSKQEAWEAIIETQDPDCTDEQRVAAWQAAIHDIAGDVDQGSITEGQWYKIKELVIDEIGAV